MTAVVAVVVVARSGRVLRRVRLGDWNGGARRTPFEVGCQSCRSNVVRPGTRLLSVAVFPSEGADSGFGAGFAGFAGNGTGCAVAGLTSSRARGRDDVGSTETPSIHSIA